MLRLAAVSSATSTYETQSLCHFNLNNPAVEAPMAGKDPLRQSPGPWRGLEPGSPIEIFEFG